VERRQQHIFDEEGRGRPARRRRIPFALRMVAPVLMTFGNAAQQSYFLPRIISGEDWWCQGYSEPGSGSDLASLRTSAVREGDHYLVNGQKTWNTLGQYADWIFCLVRTSSEGRPQQGISFLLIDMKSPGVTVRPIITLEGEHEINDIWFENVQVPVQNLVGEENKGWTYAKFLLSHERTNNAGIGNCKRALKRLKEIASKQTRERPAADRGPPLSRPHRPGGTRVDGARDHQSARAVGGCERIACAGTGSLTAQNQGIGNQQRLAELQMHALGHDALPLLREALEMDWVAEPDARRALPAYAPPLTGQYFNQRKTTIYAGSTEIQKNIISKLILGL
jgi:alkylation response protein AidB-like acyl-CoA dehydrogenase